MIPTIIIDKKNSELRSLQNQIKNFCPQLSLNGIAESECEYQSLLKDFGLGIVFINPQIIAKENIALVKSLGLGKVIICVSKDIGFAREAAYWNAAGYLLKPTNRRELVLAVATAHDIILKAKEERIKEKLLRDLIEENEEERLVGIPTVDGYEIILVDHIIRLEGLQKCTRIVTIEEKDIISSYSIGKFRQILQKYKGFFTPHRSYLINLSYTRKYKKIGELIMKDGSTIPLAKSRKEDFLHHITLL